MTETLRLFLLLALALYFAVLVYFLRRRTLDLKYTLLWLLCGVLMLLQTLFPQLLPWLSALVGIYDPTNALFALLFFCMLMLLMSLTAIASKQTEQTKRLAQSVALLEQRVRALEAAAQGREADAKDGEEA